jgi:hypothetical protein
MYWPNKMVRIYLTVLEDIMGKNGLNSVLHAADLDRLIDNYPPNDLKREFDFAEFAALNQGMDDTYGPRGGRVFALRGGKASVKAGLDAFGAAVGVSGLALKILPLNAKLRIGLPAMAKIFSTFSDQVSRVKEQDDRFVYATEQSDCSREACTGSAAARTLPLSRQSVRPKAIKTACSKYSRSLSTSPTRVDATREALTAMSARRR